MKSETTIGLWKLVYIGQKLIALTDQKVFVPDALTIETFATKVLAEARAFELQLK